MYIKSSGVPIELVRRSRTKFSKLEISSRTVKLYKYSSDSTDISGFVSIDKDHVMMAHLGC